MKDRTGKDFEKLVGRIYDIISSDERHTSVEVDVELESPDGPRQFDVVIHSKVAGIDVTTVVEVRDWNKNLSVTHVDGLHSKMNDVNANKAVLVARKGFSRGAKKKAARLGIDLCTAHDLRNIEDFVPKAPVVVHYLNFVLFYAESTFTKTSRTPVDFARLMAGGESAMELFRSDLASRNYEPNVCTDNRKLEAMHEEVRRVSVPGYAPNTKPYGEFLNRWKPPEGHALSYIDPVTGREQPITDFEVGFVMKYDYYFGYLNDLPGTFALTSISAQRSDLFYRSEDLYDFESRFSRFSNLEDVPVDEGVNIFAIAQMITQ